MSWPLRPVAELCEFAVDCVNKTAPLVDHETPYKMIRTTNVKSGFIDIENVRYVSKDTYDKWTRRSRPRFGDVVLTREAPVGEVGRCTFPDEEHIFLGQRLFHFRPDPQKLDWNFLAYVLQSPEVQGRLHGRAFGATVPHVKVGDAESLLIPCPPIDEQQRVGNVLACYDDLIATNQRRIVLLEEAARLLYREWFVQLRFPGHESLTLQDGLPEGWRRATLGELCDEVPGGSVQTGPFGSQLHQHDYKAEGVPVVMPQDIVGDRIRHDRIAFVDEATAARLDRHALHPLDIVFPRRGDIAKRALVEAHQAGYLCGTGCLKISLPLAPLHPLVLYFQLADPTMVKWIEGQAVGATMLNLSATILKSVSCLVPSEDAQARFVEIVSDIRRQIDFIERSITETARARDLLLPKLMSGQLDVSRIPLPEEVAA